jgi:hypothetical protein
MEFRCGSGTLSLLPWDTIISTQERSHGETVNQRMGRGWSHSFITTLWTPNTGTIFIPAEGITLPLHITTQGTKLPIYEPLKDKQHPSHGTFLIPFLILCLNIQMRHKMNSISLTGEVLPGSKRYERDQKVFSEPQFRPLWVLLPRAESI